MTSRQARQERREAERKAARLAYKAAKTDRAEIGSVSKNSPPAPPPHIAPLPPTDPPAANPAMDDALATQPEIGFVSQKRVSANRRNAKLSTGPRTLQGKSASSGNSLQHGLASGQILIAGEDPAAFDSLLHQLLQEHHPTNSTEKLLVQEMAQSWWLAQRAIRLQNACFSDQGVNEKQLSLFLRYQTTHQRSFYKALHALSLQKKTQVPQRNGFVSQLPEFIQKNGLPADAVPLLSELPIGFVSQDQQQGLKSDGSVRKNTAGPGLNAARQAA